LTPRRKRLFVVLGIVGGVAASVSLAVMASRENIMFYYDPSQIAAGKAPVAKRFRVGGMVVKGSVSRKPGDLEVKFVLTDFAHQVKVSLRMEPWGRMGPSSRTRSWRSTTRNICRRKSPLR
jgi:cytochrome c-type biogenesis protein CcmE